MTKVTWWKQVQGKKKKKKVQRTQKLRKFSGRDQTPGTCGIGRELVTGATRNWNHRRWAALLFLTSGMNVGLSSTRVVFTCTWHVWFYYTYTWHMCDPPLVFGTLMWSSTCSWHTHMILHLYLAHMYDPTLCLAHSCTPTLGTHLWSSTCTWHTCVILYLHLGNKSRMTQGSEAILSYRTPWEPSLPQEDLYCGYHRLPSFAYCNGKDVVCAVSALIPVWLYLKWKQISKF